MGVLAIENAGLLRDKLKRGQFAATVEIDPPRGADPGPALERVKRLKGIVDAVNVADSPMANLRMAPIAVSHLIQRDLGLEAVFHLTCRDRNLLGLQAELLGATALGVRNILCLTGDPPTRGNHPTARGVFDVDVSGLVKMAGNLNLGKDWNGNDLEGAADFFIGVVCNPGAADQGLEEAKFRSKVSAGAHFCQTQPVFDPETLRRFAERIGDVEVYLLYGVLPLKSYKSANYLRTRVGMAIPDEIMERMRTGGPEEGVRIAREAAEAVKSLGHGVHIFPMGDPELAAAVLA